MPKGVYVRDKHNPRTRASEHRNSLRRIKYLTDAYLAPWGGPAWVEKRLGEMGWGKLRGMARVCGLGPWPGHPTGATLITDLLAWLERRRALLQEQHQTTHFA